MSDCKPCPFCWINEVRLLVVQAQRRRLENHRDALARQVERLHEIWNHAGSVAWWLAQEARGHLVKDTPRGEWSFNRAVLEISESFRTKMQL